MNAVVQKSPGGLHFNTVQQTEIKKPTLLSHGDLVTLTHELGHAIHKLAQGYRRSHPQDFVKVPSIIAENWIYQPSLLHQISCHYTYLDLAYLAGWKSDYPTYQTLPPQQAPPNMFKEIAYKRNPRNDLGRIQYLLWASQFDFTIHSAFEKELKSIDLRMICN
jgi:metallopeptidase MepB